MVSTTPAVREIAPGAFHLPGCLTLPEQKALVARCRELASGPGGLYTPVLRSGLKMSVEMMCLGRHWNPKTYRYESTRSDHDGVPVRPIPPDWFELARRMAAFVGMALEPEICIVNYYGAGAKLGLHQDKDEAPETLAAGIPVVSVSLGNTARFLFGGIERKHPTQTVVLASGDGFVFGGASRLRYHGVSGVVAGTAPEELGLEGRFNLTFRR